MEMECLRSGEFELIGWISFCARHSGHILNINICQKKIQKIVVFKIKSRHYLELLTLEVMKLLKD